MKLRNIKNTSSETVVSSETSHYSSDNISKMMNNLNIGDTLKLDIRMKKIGCDLVVKESSSKIIKAEPQNTSYISLRKTQQPCPYAEIEKLLQIENILDTELLTKTVKEASEIYENYKAEEKSVMASYK
uniref:GSKIP domain-containing protein n=2 Tax=Strongyloides stercoralis TaxID=6248 RepID=A0A0K0EIK9_STRER